MHIPCPRKTFYVSISKFFSLPHLQKEFIDFVEKYPDVGQKLTPIATVLPAELTVLENIAKEDAFCSYPVDFGLLRQAKRGVPPQIRWCWRDAEHSRAKARNIFSPFPPEISHSSVSADKTHLKSKKPAGFHLPVLFFTSFPPNIPAAKHPPLF